MSQWKRAKTRKRLPFGLKLLLLVAIMLALLLFAESKITPIIDTQAMQQAHIIALRELTSSINRQLQEHPEAGSYQTLMHIERDNEGKIVLMSADAQLINLFVNDLLIDLDISMDELSQEKLKIPLLAATGSRFLAALGPNLPVGIRPIATPTVRLSDSFVSAGINQVKHSIYLEAEAKVQVAVPFIAETCTVSTQILLAEGIIIGDIPETFVQFDSSSWNFDPPSAK